MDELLAPWWQSARSTAEQEQHWKLKSEHGGGEGVGRCRVEEV